MICRIISSYRIIEKLGSSKPVSGNTNNIIHKLLSIKQSAAADHIIKY